jgi:hypothetical protein
MQEGRIDWMWEFLTQPHYIIELSLKVIQRPNLVLCSAMVDYVTGRGVCIMHVSYTWSWHSSLSNIHLAYSHGLINMPDNFISTIRWHEQLMGPIPLYHTVTYEGFAWQIITGSRLSDRIYWHCYCNYNQLWQLTINDCLRLTPFLAGQRVSSLLRDWPGSNLQVGLIISFCCSLVNTAQLNADLSREWILQCLKCTRPPPWTISCHSPIIPGIQGNRCPANDHIRHSVIWTMIMTMSLRMAVTMMAITSWFQIFLKF